MQETQTPGLRPQLGSGELGPARRQQPHTCLLSPAPGPRPLATQSQARGHSTRSHTLREGSWQVLLPVGRLLWPPPLHLMLAECNLPEGNRAQGASSAGLADTGPWNGHTPCPVAPSRLPCGRQPGATADGRGSCPCEEGVTSPLWSGRPQGLLHSPRARPPPRHLCSLE